MPVSVDTMSNHGGRLVEPADPGDYAFLCLPPACAGRVGCSRGAGVRCDYRSPQRVPFCLDGSEVVLRDDDAK
jgi:hypothetical protein